MHLIRMGWIVGVLAVITLACAAYAGPRADEGWVDLFPSDGAPAGWLVREWFDVAQPAPGETAWTVRNSVLSPGARRGTWLLSPKQYGDFILEFEIRLTDRGNSGVALRSPLRGDPAFDGMELQFADFRYNTAAAPSELTGGIYRAIAPLRQVYKPEAWNHARVELRGSRLKVVLNDVVIQSVDLAKFDMPVKRHDGSDAPAIKDRPRRGHIGFQHLSRDNAPIQIRKVRIKEL